MTEQYDFVAKRFKKLLKRLDIGIPDAVEVVSWPVTTAKSVYKTLGKVDKNTPIWQHTPTYHIAAMYLQKGSGDDFSRPLIDLYHSGIHTMDEFKKAWFEHNMGEFEGDIPKPKSSFTMNGRRKQRSYIVADTAHENIHSQLPNLPENGVDRTHLIPFTAIGKERSIGLLIDYDSYLNRNDMNDYENRILRRNREQDLIWITSIYPTRKGLTWRYLILDAGGHTISRAKWIDDRWPYYWRYDARQEKIGKEN